MIWGLLRQMWGAVTAVAAPLRATWTGGPTTRATWTGGPFTRSTWSGS